MQLARVIETSAQVAATRSRTAKVEALADTLREVVAEGPALVEVVADYLAGRLPQRRIGIGWRRLRELPAPAATSSLTVAEVDQAFTALAAMAGSGSQAARSAALAELMGRATDREQRWLGGLITGELRQGASDGVLQKAIATAAEVPEPVVRRAVMLAGFAGPVAAAALEAGVPALERIRLEVGRPLRPMLAASAPDISTALADTDSEVAVESKLDGIRVQAHLDRSASAGQVRLFTRTLEEVTERLPEVVEAVAALPADRAVLDGEVVALDGHGRPEPFQVTGARTASTADPQRLRTEVPLTTYLFDLLHRDGRDLVDEPAHLRWDELTELTGPDSPLLVPRLVTDDPGRAEQFFGDRVAAGHEGVVVKSLDGPYAAGRRGAGWVKVKPRHTLDLVVLAVEWGSGRRRGWLSNIHLGARDETTGELVMLGKTFKGMTDAMLTWQTQRFQQLAVPPGEQVAGAPADDDPAHVVRVRPEQVVEIAFDGVQRSRRYPGGVALRFARVLRYRDDKPVEQIDTLQAVRALGGVSGDIGQASDSHG